MGCMTVDTSQHRVNRFTAVSFYLDEAGALKSLPYNPRAASIASICGLKDVRLCGDMYIGRTGVYPGGGVKNESIFLSEIDSAAQWMKEAERNNYQVGIAANRVVMDKDTAAAAADEDG
jgi:peptide deformylase